METKSKKLDAAGPKKPEAAGQELPTAADLVADLCRLFGRLGEHSIFKESKLDLPDWAFLRSVIANPGLGPGPISNRIGVTPQRGSQHVAQLVANGLLNSSPSDEDSRKKDISVTPVGVKRVKEIDGKLAKLFDPLGPEISKVLTNLSRQTRKLTKTISPPGKPKAD